MAKDNIYTLTKHAGSSLTRVRQVEPISNGIVTYGVYESGFAAAAAGLPAGSIFIVGEGDSYEGIKAVTPSDVKEFLSIQEEGKD